MATKSASERCLAVYKLKQPFCLDMFFKDLQVEGSSYKDKSLDVLDVFGAREFINYCENNPGVEVSARFGQAYQRAYQRWVDFFPTLDDILNDITQKHRQGFWTNEIEFNVYMSKKILAPLAGGSCVLNYCHMDAVNASNEGPGTHLFLPEHVQWQGLGMRFKGAYLGEADIMVFPEERNQMEGGCIVEGCLDNAKIFGRKDCNIEMDGSTINEFPPISVVLALSSCIGTAITAGKIQKELQGTSHGTPTIRISPIGYDLIVYSPEFDVLLMSHFAWSPKALLILWIVLHYKLFPISNLGEFKHFPCGYLQLAQQYNRLREDPDYEFGTVRPRIVRPTLFVDRSDVEVEYVPPGWLEEEED